MCFLLCTVVSLISMAQTPHAPDVQTQRAAMHKIQFLVGTWSGRARVWRGPDSPVDLIQTEQVTYKLDGLILAIEGVGNNKSDGKVMLQALGLISFDDETGAYRMRAFNDGRWLESEVLLDDSGKGLRWGFTINNIKTNSALRIDENGDWTELHQVAIGSEPSRKFMEVTVKRQK